MVPIINEKVYHFGPRGLYDGLVLLGDDETESYWNHITGECVHGPRKGKQMKVFPIEHTDVKSALKKYKDLQIAFSKPPLVMRLLAPIMNRGRKKAFLPPGFRRTMDKVDQRLPEMMSGLGIIDGNIQRFYSVDSLKKEGGRIQDTINNKNIMVYLENGSNIPRAEILQNPENIQLLQLYTRWYGFYLTYPDCEVYEKGEC
jgi:hypothetical protein